MEQAPDGVLGVCSSCGSTMTMPRNRDTKRIAAHNAGNYFRRIGSFEKALVLYQQLLREDPTDAEAAYCAALCRFEVTYELNTANGSYYPTVNNHRQGNILEDPDYGTALKYSSGAVRQEYEYGATQVAQLLEPTTDVAKRPPRDSNYELKQAFLFLEQGRWTEADLSCDRYLALHPDNAMAWLGKLLAEIKQKRPKDLVNSTYSFEFSRNYSNTIKYADPALRQNLQACLERVKSSTRQRETSDRYLEACAAMKNASNKEQYQRAAAMFARLSGYRDADSRRKECLRNADRSEIDDLYLKGVSAANTAKTASDYRRAAELLEQTRGWRDTNDRLLACIEKMEELEAAQRQRNEKAAESVRKFRKNTNWKRVAIVTFSLLLVLAIGGYASAVLYFIPESRYQAAEALLQNRNREAAIAAYRALGDYKDSVQKVEQIQADWYAEAEEMLNLGFLGRAASVFGGLEDYADSRERSISLWNSVAQRPRLCVGGWFTAGLMPDGTAAAFGDNREGQCELFNWEDLTAISAGWGHTIGLTEGGTVVAAGYNGDGRGAVEDWKDIVSISAGQWHTVGLRINGTVVGTGCENDGRIDFTGWSDIVAISAGRHHTVGLRSTGTVVAAGSNEAGQCNLSGWTDITAVSAGGDHTLGLRRDGTAFATGSNQEGQCQISEWEDLVAVAAGYYHSVGLRADGTVVAVGLNEDGQCDVSKWKDVVAIAAGGWHTVGLKADGTLVTTGRALNGQCDAELWLQALEAVQNKVPVPQE